VSALNSIFIISSNELGAFESGFASKLMGVIPSVVFGSLMTMGITGYAWFKFPKIRTIQY